jgi:hypothetical protein
VDTALAIVICLALVAFAARMIRSHAIAWRALEGDSSLEPCERQYHHRQLRRRFQTSAMLGILGIAVLVGQLLRPPVPRAVILAYWAATVLLSSWIVLLAVADMVSTRMFFGRIHHGYLVEATRLRREFRRAERIRNKGQTENDGHAEV